MCVRAGARVCVCVCVCVFGVCGVCVFIKYRTLISYNMRYLLRNFIRIDFELILIM